MNKEQAKEEVKKLIAKYEQVKTSGKIKSYTEEETKNAFIKPLFEVLGWDFSNKEEVSAEESILSSGRVDFGLYINGRAKLYIEAKPLKADLNQEEYARQAIRYSWNRDVTWAILTDFEGLKVFNAKAASKYLGDKLFFSINYDEYLERFEQLWLLSKDSFLNNLLDKEAERVGKKIIKSPITDSLYKDFNKCREILTNDLNVMNEGIDKELLDEGVQRLLDRLIFIRVAEDRGIEPSTLIPLLRSWENSDRKKPLYAFMISKFRELDKVYNSNLFSPHPFENWVDYGDSTKKVIKILYGTEGYNEYDFKVIPADILGSVYENYLGYKLSQSQKGLSLDKAAGKRKEQGIYYTPAFIVDYIVRNALKPVLDKCVSVNDLKKIKVLDPACGSGSFLVKALEVIVEKYIEFNYEDDENLRKQILLDNIFGVDLDEQAVEIAKLNLLINTLREKGELPSLNSNIKNGNSLISGTDKELEKYFGKDFRKKKPFNFKEQFPKIFQQGGFDVVIGNPPYVNMYSLKKEDVNFFKNKYILASGYFDLFSIFIEMSINNLKTFGNLGFIIPSLFLKGLEYQPLRKYINENSKEVTLKEMGDRVFANVNMPTCILNLTKQQNESNKDFFESKIDIFRRHQMVKLGALSIIRRGLEIGQDKIKSEGKIKCFSGRDIGRYVIKSSGYINSETFDKYQKTNNIFSPPKIIVRETGDSIIASYEEEGVITTRSLYNLKTTNNSSLLFVLAILNSKLYRFYFKTYISPDTKIFPKIRIEQLREIPIIYPNEKQKIKIFEDPVSKMLKLNKELFSFPEGSNKWNSIKEEIDKTDKKIDGEVYKLYDLTPEEIKIVENS